MLLLLLLLKPLHSHPRAERRSQAVHGRSGGRRRNRSSDHRLRLKEHRIRLSKRLLHTSEESVLLLDRVRG